MKKTILTIFSAVFLAGVFLITGCQNNTITNVGTSVIRGTITDSLTNSGVQDVVITTIPATLTGITTDAQGKFTLPGIGAGDYTIVAKKLGWFTKNYMVTVADADSAAANFKMLFSNIYAYDNLTASEFFNDNSFSAVNLYLGKIVTELDATNKDIQLRDSVGMSERFLFRSGDLALDNPGYGTVFGDPVFSGRNFTKYQFDSLSKYYTIDGQIDPSRDFPNDRTAYYTPNSIVSNHHVYPFYLLGRYTSNPGNPRVYGLLYINYLTRDTISPQQPYKFTVDVKINRNGQNSFNLNQ
jgi:predicted small secreted protein